MANSKRVGVAASSALVFVASASLFLGSPSHAYPPSVPSTNVTTTTDGSRVLTVTSDDPTDTVAGAAGETPSDASTGTLPQTGSSIDLGAISMAAALLVGVGALTTVVRRRRDELPDASPG